MRCRRGGRWNAALAVLVLSIAAGQPVGAALEGDSRAWQAMTGLNPGPLPVGFRVVEMEDETRPGFTAFDQTSETAETAGGPSAGAPGGASRSRSRRVRAWLWYPAGGPEGEPVTLSRYVTEGAEDFAFLGGADPAEMEAQFHQKLVQHGVRQEDLADRLQTPMLAREEAAPGAGPYPLVLLGQGFYYESPLAQTILSEYLASHGFVVATTPLMGTSRPGVEITVEDLSTQVADLAFLLGRVPSLLPIDPSRVAAAGFDLGGMAALLLQMEEPAIRALVSFDAGIIFRHNMALLEEAPGFRGPGLTVPTIQFTRDAEGNRAGGVEEDFSYFEHAATGELYLVRIPGMRHPDFTSYALYGTVPTELPFWGAEVVSPRQSMATVTVTVRDFLRTYLIGDPEARAALEDLSASAAGSAPTVDPDAGITVMVTKGRGAGKARSRPRSGWVPPWSPELQGPYLGQPLPGDTPEIFAEGIVALGNHEHHLTLAPEGKEMLYVIADKYRTRHTLIRVVEQDGVWQAPEVAPFSGRYNDFAPSFFPDGSALLFCSNRPLPGTDEPTDDSNIWKVERTAEGWGEPHPLPLPVNDGTSEYNPSLTRDGTLVFQDHDEGGADIYSTRFIQGAWEPPEKIPNGVSSPHAEITPYVTGNGDLLVFASDRPGGFGALDLYASHRLPDGAWSEPVNLGKAVNTEASEAVPTLSPDDQVFFFTSFLGYESGDFLNRSYVELVHMLRSARNGDGTLFWVSGQVLEEVSAGLQIEQRKGDAIDSMVEEFFGSGLFPSLSVGLVKDDELVYARALGVADKGTDRPATIETIYELGSVGKVLTSTVLAILHDRGVVRIDDPVQKWVPAIADIPQHPEGGPQITLEHLATHTSGLPGIPANVDHLPPYQWKGYSPELLDDGFKKTELGSPAGEQLVYSTLGMGLVGHILAIAAGKTYIEVIEDELLIPLGMNDTVIQLREEQKERYSVGYESNESSAEVPYYEYGILAGGGAHRSTVPDLARFLEAQWESPTNSSNPVNENVRRELHRIRWESEDGQTAIALGWFAEPQEGIGTLLVHRGRTPGHGAVVGLIPEKRAGVIVLANRGGRETNVMMEDFAEKLLLRMISDME